MARDFPSSTSLTQSGTRPGMEEMQGAVIKVMHCLRRGMKSCSRNLAWNTFSLGDDGKEEEKNKKRAKTGAKSCNHGGLIRNKRVLLCPLSSPHPSLLTPRVAGLWYCTKMYSCSTGTSHTRGAEPLAEVPFFVKLCL